MFERTAEVDYRAFLNALPTACMLLDAELGVTEASAAFLSLTGRTRDQVIGRPMLASFPDRPGHEEAARARRALEESARRALATGAPDEIDRIRYDIEQVPGSGRYEERWWRVRNCPVPDGDGRPCVVLNSVDDVTHLVQARERQRRQQQREDELLARTERLEYDLDASARERSALAAAERQAGRRLQGLAFVALELAAADSVEELTDLVVVRGVAAMGCDGGGVAVRDDDEQVVRLTITDTWREGQRLRQEMPYSTHLPSVVAAIVPEPIFLGTREEGLAWGPEMDLVYTTSGREAWASLPLLAEGEHLGSLTVSWVEARAFTDDEKALLAAFAAQCAQALLRIRVRQAEREAMVSSRLLSESLQRSLLTEPAQPDDMQVVTRYLPAAREAYVGGDWYDAFQVPGGDTLLVVGDVAGHDRQATAAMAQVRGVLRGVAHSLDASPAQVLTGLDHAMRDLRIDALVTGVLARVRTASHPAALTWSNAGHLPPIVIRPDGAVEVLDRDADLLLGVLPATARHDHELAMPPGTTVLLFTDGLVERRGESLSQGLEWLRRRVTSLSALPLDVLCDTLLTELPSDVDDDIAILAVRAVRPGVPTATGSAIHPGATAVAPDVEPMPPVRRRPDVSMVLPLDVSGVRRARAFVRQHCQAAEVDHDVCDTMVLLTSETVTNAFIHGRSEARLRLLIRPDAVRIEVGDDNSRHPKRIERQDDALDGRGLDILDLLATRWGVVNDIAGKVVWFEVSREVTGP
ncbi:MAG: SpoIIE family protein phosphatase [Angustibacter sp.]